MFRLIACRRVFPLSLVVLIFVLLHTPPVWADSISPITYEMPNGYGQAHGGASNYWDLFYTGSGSTTTDGDLLMGGLGDLTDGIVASGNWSVVENPDGTGPYVGWCIDPTITFYFAAPVAFQTVCVHVDDNNRRGGGGPPLAAIISSNSEPLKSRIFPIADPPTPDPFWLELDVSGMGLTGSSIRLTLLRRSVWMFVSEVQFTGVSLSLQPDLWIKQGLNWCGNDFYNDDGTDQTGSRAVLAGVTAVYQVRLYNDGDETETFWIKGPTGDENWTVQYFQGATEVTAQVTSGTGWKRPRVPVGAMRPFTIKVTPQSGEPSGSSREVLVRAESNRAPIQRDVIKAVTTVK